MSRSNINTYWLFMVLICSQNRHVSAACDQFSSFPESMAVSIGTNVCFICDYPGTENEVWSTSCQDNNCTCNISDVSPGVQLCFTNFHSNCSGNYQCNASTVEPALACSAQALIVATNDAFIEHPVSVTAVLDNRVSFTCTLISGNTGILWQWNNTNDATFVTSTTPPGNYILDEPNTLTIDGVQSDNVGEYRCAYEIEQDIYLYSDYGELEYLGEGITFSFEQTTHFLYEGVTSIVCITASGSIPESYTVDISVMSSDGTAHSGLDYNTVNISRTFSEIQNPICVFAVGIVTEVDSLVEDDEQFIVSLSSNSFIVTVGSELLVTIQNLDVFTIGFEQSSYTVQEGTSLMACIVSFGGEIGNLVITYSVFTEDGTATTLESNYVAVYTQGTITSSSDMNCLGSINVMTVDDSTVQQQYFYIKINSSETADRVYIIQDSAIVHIKDNDGVIIQFEQLEYSFVENDPFSFVTVMYETELDEFSIEYRIISLGQLSIGYGYIDDFIRVNKTVEINQTSSVNFTFLFETNRDYIVEDNETVIVEVSSTDALVIIDTPTILITIIDDNKRIDVHLDLQPTNTFHEGDPPGEACISTENQTVYDFNIGFNGSVAINNPELKDPLSLTLEVGETSTCTRFIVPREDNRAEGTSIIYFVYTTSDRKIIINADYDGEILEDRAYFLDTSVFEVNFQYSSYMVNETDSNLTVCLEKVGDVSIVQDVVIPIDFIEVSNHPLVGIAFEFPSQPLEFSSEDTIVCGVLTIINDPSLYDDRSTLFGVETCDSQFQISGNFTNITFLNRQGGCPVDVNGGIQWQWTLESTIAYKPCSEAGSMFRVGPQASRRCNEEGYWEEADLTSCTIAAVEDPFLLVWFVIEADEYTDDLEESFIASMEGLLDMNGVVYSKVSVKSVYIASVAITFQVDLPEGDQSQNISKFNSFVGDPESFSSFSDYSVMEGSRGLVDITVADTCMCSSADNMLQLCSGAAISPCDCMDTVCMCQTPFVGDGISCTLDSDGDGYPDQALESPSCAQDTLFDYCKTDVCPEVANPEQDPVACQPDATTMEVFVGCPYGVDDEWGITWPNTPGGSISTQPCPGGVDDVGTATRVCYETGTWGAPDVLSCNSLQILHVSQLASELLPDADAEIDEVTVELIENVAVVSEQLVMATGNQVETGLLPLDLNSTNNIVAQVLNVLESSVEDGIDDIPNEELVDVFNNILNETNEGGWRELQTISSGSQTLLQNAERYGKYLATTVNDTDEPLMLVRENIIVTAEVVDTSSNVSDVVFPAYPDQLDTFTAINVNDTVQITIPGDALNRITTSVSNLSIVHIVFRNIENFLPANISNLSSNSRAESLVISSQVDTLDQREIPDDIFNDNPIILNFSFTAGSDRVVEYLGVFWEFSDPVGNGGWSSDGVQVISNETRGNLTTVQCSSTHLTSFAVLVDVAGGLENVPKEETFALQLVSYIGCTISIISLSITVAFYLAMGKKLFSAVHYFIHLNLALTLLLGYVVFMLGIELGTSSKGTCIFVTALLQYLFLSAFCWMMCEGIMLYLMLIVVFSSLSKKWWFFMIIGYCTPLIFVVVGLAVKVDNYTVKRDDGELLFCWLSTKNGAIFLFVGPILLVIIINTVFLVMALKTLSSNKKQKIKAQDKHKSTKQAMTLLKAAIILLPLLGLTWLFGVLTLNNNTTVFAWLFTIFNSLQGTGIFFFHVILSKQVWSKISPKLYLLKQCIFRSSIKYKSTFYSSQSSNVTVQGFLHKKSDDSKHSYGQAIDSIVNGEVSDTELKISTAGGDIDQMSLEPMIPEVKIGEDGMISSNDTIVNLHTTRPTSTDSDSEESKEEISSL